jgi:hypothetical protein
MKIFILQRVQCCNAINYHSEGGIVIIAKDINHAKEMIKNSQNSRVDDDEWETAEIFELKGKNINPKFWLMEDAGCC